MNLKAILEGLLFVVGDEGLTKEQMKNILEIDDIKLTELLQVLNCDYETRGIEIETFGERYKLITKREYKEYLQKLVETDDSDFLSLSALETLAIIAYNQPITRITVDEIRGINSSHMIRKLVFKDLIKEVGRTDSPGKPILYGTTDLFLDYFGLKSLDALPIVNETESETEVINIFDSKYKEE